MHRRNFIYDLAWKSLATAAIPMGGIHLLPPASARELSCQVLIAGGGLGGCAAALAACRHGMQVILTEETDWIGGQISQQGVPPDEHQWIESHGAPASYRAYRNKVRDYYRAHYPLTNAARTNVHLNPGNGAVSRLCHEPRVCVAVLMQMLAPYLSQGNLQLFTRLKAVDADVEGDSVQAVRFHNLVQDRILSIEAEYVIDATELGDLLPLTNTEYVTGTESQGDTGELHAPEKADPTNHQAFTLCFAMDYSPGEDHTIDLPEDYDKWRDYRPAMDPPWAGTLIDLDYSNPRTLEPKLLGFDPSGAKTGDMLNLWNYRKLIDRHNFQPGTYHGDITVVNWPQNDFFPGNIIDVDTATVQKHLYDATQLNLSLLYWLQTEAPRPDGGMGWPGVRLRPDVMGTKNGMAKYPYVREARRIKPVFRILEEHVGKENRMLVAGEEDGKRAASFYDSVGIGYYHIDLHPSTNGNNYIDFPSLPFEIPLGALLPERMQNLLPANKNIGTTHITNGCFRLHPVEWSIGEAVGLLASFAKRKKTSPHAIRAQDSLLQEYQRFIQQEGVEIKWPE